MKDNLNIAIGAGGRLWKRGRGVCSQRTSQYTRVSSVLDWLTARKPSVLPPPPCSLRTQSEFLDGIRRFSVRRTRLWQFRACPRLPLTCPTSPATTRTVGARSRQTPRSGFQLFARRLPCLPPHPLAIPRPPGRSQARHAPSRGCPQPPRAPKAPAGALGTRQLNARLPTPRGLATCPTQRQRLKSVGVYLQ